MKQPKLLKDMSEQEIVNAIYANYVIGDQKPGFDESKDSCVYGELDQNCNLIPNGGACFVGFFIPRTQEYMKLFRYQCSASALARNLPQAQKLLGSDERRLVFLDHLQRIHDGGRYEREMAVYFNSGHANYAYAEELVGNTDIRKTWGVGLENLCDHYNLTYPGNAHA